MLKKSKSVQHKAVSAIAAAIQSSSREKVYKELGLKTVKPRGWLKKMCCFHKIKNSGILFYLVELINSKSHLYNTWNLRNITTYSCITDAFQYSSFLLMINEWNKLNFYIGTSSLNIYRTSLMKVF